MNIYTNGGKNNFNSRCCGNLICLYLKINKYKCKVKKGWKVVKMINIFLLVFCDIYLRSIYKYYISKYKNNVRCTKGMQYKLIL